MGLDWVGGVGFNQDFRIVDYLWADQMKSEDLKYIESLFDSAYIGLASRVSSARLAGVARSYEANMKRTRAFLRLPSTIGHFAVVFMKIEAWTLAEMMDSEQFPNLTREQIIENKTFRDAYNVIALRRLAEENSQNLADPDAAKLIWETGVNNVNQLVNQGGPVIEEAFQSLFASVLVGSWTAFETLVADLWEAALNESPELGFVALDAEPDPEDDEDEQDKKRKTKYSVPLWMLKKLNYDLRNSLGRVDNFWARCVG